MSKYDPALAFSIAARAAENLRVAESGMPESSIPQSGMPEFGIPKSTIPESDTPDIDTPKAPVEVPENKWFKCANWLFDDLSKYITGSQWIVYMYLYRLSVGFHKTDCRVGYGALAKMTGLSRNTVRDAVIELKNLGLIHELDTNQDGTAMLLMVPAGVLESGIPKSGIPKTDIPESDTPKSGIPKINPMGVSEVGIPKTDTPFNPQLNPGVAESGIPQSGTNKDSTIYNNRQLVRELGFEINQDVANVDERRIRECAMYVRNQNARNPNAMFLAALKEDWDVGADIRKAVAAGEAMREAERREARQKEEDRTWLESEKARLGETELNRLRNQALSRCGLAYQLARSEEVRGAILEGELNAMLLEQRDSDI